MVYDVVEMVAGHHRYGLAGVADVREGVQPAPRASGGDLLEARGVQGLAALDEIADGFEFHRRPFLKMSPRWGAPGGGGRWAPAPDTMTLWGRCGISPLAWSAFSAWGRWSAHWAS